LRKSAHSERVVISLVFKSVYVRLPIFLVAGLVQIDETDASSQTTAAETTA